MNDLNAYEILVLLLLESILVKLIIDIKIGNRQKWNFETIVIYSMFSNLFGMN